MYDHLGRSAVEKLISEHEEVYSPVSAPMPVREIADDTMGFLADEVPDPRTKMESTTRPRYEVSGLLLYDKMEVWLRAADHPNRKRFSLAHELAHARLHCQPTQQPSPLSRAVFACGKKEIAETGDTDESIEREANSFAAELLLPTRLLEPKVSRVDVMLSVVLELAQEFEVSPVCMAIRIAREAWQPYAMVVSSKGRVEFSFRSAAMKEFSINSFIHKGVRIDKGTETARFFERPEWIAEKRKSDRIVDPSRWFFDYEGNRRLVEEAVGLGYGKVLTVLTRDYEEAWEEECDDAD